MLFNILVGFTIMIMSLILQTSLMMYTIRYYHHKHEPRHVSIYYSIFTISMIMLLLVLGNLGQIALWAMAFLMLEEFQGFATAFYHSTVNFTSLGYGDIVMSEKNRLLGALEALNGVLMVGVSTASLTYSFKMAIKKYIQPSSS